MESKKYKLSFYNHSIPIEDCKICLKSTCNYCSNGYFYLCGRIDYLFKIYTAIETETLNILTNNIRIYRDPDFHIPLLPICNVESVYGLRQEIEYPLTINYIFYYIHYASDQELLQYAPINLQDLRLYINPHENIENLFIGNSSPYLKHLIMQLNYTKYKCCVDINEIPDTVECLTIITNFCDVDKSPYTFIGNIWRLPSKLKKIVLDMPLKNNQIFGDASSINLISKVDGVEYKGIGMQQCQEVLKQYCANNDIEMVFITY